MNDALKQTFADAWSDDRAVQNTAYYALLEATAAPVDWSYAVWDEVVAQLSHADNHNRSIAAQLLSSLAKSDPEERLLKDFPKLFAVTKDERFVTARHALQSLWQVGVVSPAYREMLVAALSGRFADCTDHKNYTLIRSDILESLRKVFDETGDEGVKHTALGLIETVDDDTYKKTYAKIWKL